MRAARKIPRSRSNLPQEGSVRGAASGENASTSGLLPFRAPSRDRIAAPSVTDRSDDPTRRAKRLRDRRQRSRRSRSPGLGPRAGLALVDVHDGGPAGKPWPKARYVEHGPSPDLAQYPGIQRDGHTTSREGREALQGTSPGVKGRAPENRNVPTRGWPRWTSPEGRWNAKRPLGPELEIPGSGSDSRSEGWRRKQAQDLDPACRMGSGIGEGPRATRRSPLRRISAAAGVLSGRVSATAGVLSGSVSSAVGVLSATALRPEVVIQVTWFPKRRQRQGQIARSPRGKARRRIPHGVLIDVALPTTRIRGAPDRSRSPLALPGRPMSHLSGPPPSPAFGRISPAKSFAAEFLSGRSLPRRVLSGRSLPPPESSPQDLCRSRAAGTRTNVGLSRGPSRRGRCREPRRRDAWAR